VVVHPYFLILKSKTMKKITTLFLCLRELKNLFYLLVFILPIEILAQTNLNNGLVAYYPFNGDAKDKSGNGNDGMATTTIKFEADRSGNNSSNSCRFNGTSDFIKIPNSTSLNPQYITIAAWVRPAAYYDGVCAGNIILTKGGEINGNYGLSFTGTNICVEGTVKQSSSFGVDLGSQKSGINTGIMDMKLNEWQFLVGTYDGKEIKYYRNGELVKPISAPGNIIANTFDLFIGVTSPDLRQSYPYWFNGWMDDIRIYNRAINDAEVKALYGSLSNGLVAYYPFNGNVNTNGDVIDESGNAIKNNGKNNGAILTTDRFGNANSAYEFNGTSSNITFAKLPTTDINNMSVSLWMKPTDLNQVGIALNYGNDNGSNQTNNSDLVADGFAIGIANGATGTVGGSGNKLQFLHCGISLFPGNYTFLDVKQWVHVVIIRESSSSKIYVNGILTATYTNPIRIPTAFIIGSATGIRYFKGAIDDIRIYNRAINDAEVKELYGSLNDGLVAYYPFNGDYKDKSENGIANDGIPTGTTLETDRLGNANSKSCRFNGTSDFIKIPNSSSLNPQFITVAAWVKPAAFYEGTCAGNIILTKARGAENDGSYSLIFTGNNVCTAGRTKQSSSFHSYLDNNSEIHAGADIMDMKLNEWQFLVGTYDGTNIKLYRNGVLVQTNATGKIITSTDDIFIGANNPYWVGQGYPFWFNGWMDDIRIYNRAINDAEVKELYGTTSNLTISEFKYYVNGNILYCENLAINAKTYDWSFTAVGAEPIKKDHNILNPRELLSSGNYNVCQYVEGDGGKASTCQLVRIAGVQSIYPNKCGSGAVFLTTIKGAGFEQGMTVQLVTPLSTITAELVELVSPIELKVKWKFEENARSDFYNVVVTLKNGTKLEGIQRFQLEQGKASKAGVFIDGPREYVRLNQPTTFSARFYQAEGNRPVYNTNVHIIVMATKKNAQFTVKPQDKVTTMRLNPNLTADELAQLHEISDGFGLINSAEYRTYYISVSAPIVFSYLDTPTFYFDIQTYSTNDEFVIFIMGGGTNRLNSPIIEPPRLCTECWKCTYSLAGSIPVVGCLTGAVDFSCTVADECESALNCDSWANVGQSFLSNAWGCIGGKFIDKFLSGFTNKIISFFSDRVSDLNTTATCIDCFANTPPDFDEVGPIKVKNSLDPNIKTGWSGKTADNFIKDNKILPYRISFENATIATAPAGQVIIRDQLDTSVFDLSTFRWDYYGWSNKQFKSQLPNNDYYLIDHDLRPAKNVILRHKAEINRKTGLIEWRFISFDPLTYALTNDIPQGFLPPNDTSRRGEGFVSYFIQNKPNIPQGTVMKNKADIIFDFNAPITTPIWINTLDKSKPKSAIQSLTPITKDTSFILKLKGTDTGSGIDFHDIYVSDNDSIFKLTFFRVQSDSIVFKGINKHKYAFFSRATDNAGNVEDLKQVADASTLVSPVSDVIKTQIAFYPNPTAGTVYIESPWENTSAQIIVSDVIGRTLFQQKSVQAKVSELDLRSFSSGIYFISLKNERTGETKVGKVVHE
jgi:Concanavalin A-like lectin/glucanases superfamily/Secretion system C-terminal sorting domain